MDKQELITEPKPATEWITKHPQWDLIKNKNLIISFYNNSVQYLYEQSILKQQDYLSLFNLTISIDELFSKIIERDSFYSETIPQIKKEKIAALEKINLNNTALIEQYEKEIKTLNFRFSTVDKKKKTLQNRIEEKKGELTKLNSKLEKFLREHEDKLKKVNKMDDVEKQKVEIALLRTQKIEFQDRVDRQSARVSKDIETAENEIFKCDSEFPTISKTISDLTLKKTELQNEIQKNVVTLKIENESLKYNYFQISPNGQAYSNDVYSIKSFVRDVQDLLNQNGLTPLSRVKITKLIQGDETTDDEGIATLLEKLQGSDVAN